MRVFHKVLVRRPLSVFCFSCDLCCVLVWGGGIQSIETTSQVKDVFWTHWKDRVLDLDDFLVGLRVFEIVISKYEAKEIVECKELTGVDVFILLPKAARFPIVSSALFFRTLMLYLAGTAIPWAARFAEITCVEVTLRSYVWNVHRTDGKRRLNLSTWEESVELRYG